MLNTRYLHLVESKILGRIDISVRVRVLVAVTITVVVMVEDILEVLTVTF